MARFYRHVDFFHFHIEAVGLVDVKPITIKPTWINKRNGFYSVSNRLDRFMVSDAVLQGVDRYRSSIDSNRCSDHNPIFL